jgi:serine/threonine protein kinase
MLTGRLPFSGDSCNQLMVALATQDPQPPTTIKPDFPAEVEQLVLKALSKNQADRFQTAETFLDALKSLNGFEDRDTRLSRYTTSITKKRIASGDLGGTEVGAWSGIGASGLIAEMANRTPDAWSKSTTGSGKIRRRRVWIGLMSVALAMAVLGLGWLILQSPAVSATDPLPSVLLPTNVVPASPQPESRTPDMCGKRSVR